MLQDKKECYFTHTPYHLHRHHIFEGANRKKSEEYGLWVWLVWWLHNGSDHALHFDRGMDLHLKRVAQQTFEEVYGHERFMREFGRNYL